MYHRALESIWLTWSSSNCTWILPTDPSFGNSDKKQLTHRNTQKFTWKIIKQVSSQPFTAWSPVQEKKKNIKNTRKTNLKKNKNSVFRSLKATPRLSKTPAVSGTQTHALCRDHPYGFPRLSQGLPRQIPKEGLKNCTSKRSLLW